MHHWIIPRSFILFVALCVVPPASADPPESPEREQPADTLDIDALVLEAETIIDVILEHHIDPPDRQELWFAGTKGMADRPRMFDPRARLPSSVPEDARRIHIAHGKIMGMTTREEFTGLLKELWSNDVFTRHRVSPSELKRAFLDGILWGVPGGANLIPPDGTKSAGATSGQSVHRNRDRAWL